METLNNEKCLKLLKKDLERESLFNFLFVKI